MKENSAKTIEKINPLNMTRCKFSDSSRYANAIASTLSVEELILIYKEVKEDLSEFKPLTDIEIESNLRAIISNLIFKDIEVAKSLIIDLINNDNVQPNINMHEVVEVSSLRFATTEETRNIFGCSKIFEWFFGEYKTIHKYKDYMREAINGRWGDIILKSLNNVLIFFIKYNENEKFRNALYLFTQSISSIEKEYFFNYFASTNGYYFTQEKNASPIQREIILNFIKDLASEESIKTKLGFNSLKVDDIVKQLTLLRYDITKNKQETVLLLKKLQKLNCEAFETALINIVKMNAQDKSKIDTASYNLEYIFRCDIKDKKQVILNNKELRNELCKNYELEFAYLPINHFGNDDNLAEDNIEIGAIIREMIDINIQYEKFNSFDFFSYHANWSFNENVKSAIVQALYDLVYHKQEKQKKYLEFLLFYYLDVKKLTSFQIDINKRKMFYKNLHDTCYKFCFDTNKLVLKNNGYNISEHKKIGC